MGGVMVSMLASNAVDRGFGHWSGQTNDDKIGICCSSIKHIVLRSKDRNGCLGIRLMCPSSSGLLF